MYTSVGSTALPPTTRGTTNLASATIDTLQTDTVVYDKIFADDIEFSGVDKGVLYNDGGTIGDSAKFTFDPDDVGSVVWYDGTALNYNGKITLGGTSPTIISGNNANNESRRLVLTGGPVDGGSVHIIGGKDPNASVASAGGQVLIYTQQKTFSTGGISIRTGDKPSLDPEIPNNGDTGQIQLTTGGCSGIQEGNSGAIIIQSGDRTTGGGNGTGSGNSGSITIGTGSNPSSAAGQIINGNTGTLTLSTGTKTRGTGQSGNINISTGSRTTDNGNSGGVSISTGNKLSGTGQSGNIMMSTGTRSNGDGNSGNVSISSGANGTGNGTFTINSGNVSVTTGSLTSTATRILNGNTGNLTLSTGNKTGGPGNTGNTGNIIIKTGNRTHDDNDGNSGDITLEIGTISGTGTKVKGELKFVNISSGAIGTQLLIDGSDNVIRDSSTRAVKYDEVLVDEYEGFDVNDVLKLKPKFFKYKRTDEQDLGLIVEDMQEDALDYLLVHNEDGGTWNKSAMITLLIKYVQQLHKRVEELEKK